MPRNTKRPREAELLQGDPQVTRGPGAPKGNLNALKSGISMASAKPTLGRPDAYSDGQQLRSNCQASRRLAMPATSDVVRRFDAAGAGKRALLAMSLQQFVQQTAKLPIGEPSIYAELLVAEPVVLADIVDLLEQTKLTPQKDPDRPSPDTAKR